MELKPIRTEAQYSAALRQASAYFDNEPEPGTKAGDRFQVLVMRIEAYRDLLSILVWMIERRTLTLTPYRWAWCVNVAVSLLPREQQ
ncbi:hypothetical protein [Burkholderia sp. L27(2015)]|uniref:hypothetical protein n=1 Tax=Burkholderia sp. L27(2015) TaxID=1641858 RepID=UPI00131CCFCB|nr:hypothetical protein [Burkholderia sp. L27(2015)]